MNSSELRVHRGVGVALPAVVGARHAQIEPLTYTVVAGEIVEGARTLENVVMVIDLLRRLMLLRLHRLLRLALQLQISLERLVVRLVENMQDQVAVDLVVALVLGRLQAADRVLARRLREVVDARRLCW